MPMSLLALGLGPQVSEASSVTRPSDEVETGEGQAENPKPLRGGSLKPSVGEAESWQLS